MIGDGRRLSMNLCLTGSACFPGHQLNERKEISPNGFIPMMP
jgi:hypothetical protein